MMKWSGKRSRGSLPGDGQVYYVYNRVKDIADVAGRVQKLVPDASVCFCTWADE